MKDFGANDAKVKQKQEKQKYLSRVHFQFAGFASSDETQFVY